MNAQDKLMVIAKSIKIRDEIDSMTKEQVYEAVKELGESEFWSYRQIVDICKKRVSHGTVGKLITKTNKRGGRLNPEHLEAFREIIFQQSVNRVNWNRVREVINGGTSPDMLARITDIPKSTIYRKAKLG